MGTPQVSLKKLVSTIDASTMTILAEIDNQLFVSKNQLHVPGPEQLQHEFERSPNRVQEA